jgi:pimeloyl-ACP methyl ester carboxylesterase
MDGYAGWVNGLLSALNVERADVMGHSMGCQVALALADRFPERVRRIVLLGPTTGGRHVSMLRDFAGLLGDSLAEPLRYNWTLLGVFARLGPIRYLRTVIEMQRDDAFLRAARGSHPLLVLRGARDRIVPERVAKELAGASPNGTYREISRAAHAAQYSQPRETADVVLSFLR